MKAVCSTTNKDNLVEHIEILQQLCQEAKHTVLLDADLGIDGMVDCFVQHTFNQGDVHKIEHKGAGLGYNYTLTDNYGELLLRLKNDLTTGKVAMVCCGSASEAKAIADGARQYLDDTQIGLYHADGEQQGALLDVNKHWPNKKLIIFTSTITCSVDSQGKVDQIYAIPCIWTTSPRVLLQIIGRARWNLNREVVVFVVVAFCRNACGPSTEDLDALHRLHTATNYDGKTKQNDKTEGSNTTSGPSTAHQKETKQEVAKSVKSNRQNLQDHLTETDSRGVSQEQFQNVVRRKNGDKLRRKSCYSCGSTRPRGISRTRSTVKLG